MLEVIFYNIRLQSLLLQRLFVITISLPGILGVVIKSLDENKNGKQANPSSNYLLKEYRNIL